MSSPDPELRWVRPARQARSERTRERFLDGAERLLSRGRSFDEVSVAELAKEAGASVGAFYTRFADKEALLHTLHLRFCREGEATVAEALAPARWEGVGLERVVAAFVEFAISTYARQQGLRRAFLVQMATRAEFRRRAAALSSATCAQLAEVLSAKRPGQSAAAIQTAVDLCHRAVYALLDQRALFGALPPAGTDLGDDELARELTELCLGYLARRLV